MHHVLYNYYGLEPIVLEYSFESNRWLIYENIRMLAVIELHSKNWWIILTSTGYKS